MDRELTKQFNVKFRDLVNDYEYADDIFVTDTLKKNKLRKYFVDNYNIIDEYYNYIINNK
jgi:hypothetical protein